MTNRGPLIAFVSAGLALAVATVAIIVVLSRGGDAAAPAGTIVDDGTVTATAIAALDLAEADARAGGVAVRGGAPALGLGERDVVKSINGRAVIDRFDFRMALSRAGLGEATVLYVEIERDGKPVLVRRKIDGDLRAAQNQARDPGDLTGNPYAIPTPPADPLATGGSSTMDPAVQAALDAIIKIDDETYVIPRATVDTILANPMAVAKGARVVPAVKNGKADGFKLYAIRPSSLYARLGLNNGDTIQSINGFELTTADQALEVYTKIQSATNLSVEISRRGRALTLSYTIR